jgi:hypothetical protein
VFKSASLSLRLLAIAVLLMCVAACAPNDEPLPTLAVFTTPTFAEIAPNLLPQANAQTATAAPTTLAAEGISRANANLTPTALSTVMPTTTATSTIPTTAWYTQSVANIYQCPDTATCQIVLTLPANEEIRVVKTENDWHEILVATQAGYYVEVRFTTQSAPLATNTAVVVSNPNGGNGGGGGQTDGGLPPNVEGSAPTSIAGAQPPIGGGSGATFTPVPSMPPSTLLPTQPSTPLPTGVPPGQTVQPTFTEQPIGTPPTASPPDSGNATATPFVPQSTPLASPTATSFAGGLPPGAIPITATPVPVRPPGQ